MKKTNVFILATLLGLATASADITASARMIKKNGSKAIGTVQFIDMEGDQVQVKYNLKNLPKNTTLGMHIHEKADCNDKDAASAGNQFVKQDKANPSANTETKFAGDLTSITSDAKGRAKGSFVAPRLSVMETNAISKRSLIIHEGNDDTHPISSRIACGLIEGPPSRISKKTNTAPAEKK